MILFDNDNYLSDFLKLQLFCCECKYFMRHVAGSKLVVVEYHELLNCTAPHVMNGLYRDGSVPCFVHQ